MLKIRRRSVSDFFTALQQLALGESNATWAEVCIVMTKLCALISIGIGLFFATGIALGFGFEITPLKLIFTVLALIAWPILMGFMLGTAVFLDNRGRQFIRKTFQHKNSGTEQSATFDSDKPDTP
jgi:hypothetical protein